MSHTDFAQSSALETFLQSCGIFSDPVTAVQALVDLNGAVASAKGQWEDDSGYLPFLAVPQTRTYDPPGPERGPVGIYVGINNMGGGRRLFTGSGLLSVSALRVGVSATNPGTLLTAGTDYWLRPQNASSFNRPYTYIEFAYPQWGNPQSITVAGSFGYAASVPDDVYEAHLRKAALLVAPQIALQISGGLYSVRRLNFELRYSGAKQSPLSIETAAWEETYRRTLQRYQRISIV